MEPSGKLQMDVALLRPGQTLKKRLRAKQSQVVSVDHVALEGVPILRIDISKADQRKVLED